MDESSAESEAEPDAPADEEDDDDGPLYPLEGRFKDAADREHILSLPEVERERIFYDREAANLRRQQTLQLRLKLKEKEREKERLEGRNKRKAGAADLDNESRRAVRPKTKKDEAMESLKRSRENRAKDNLRRDAGRTSRRSRSRTAGSSDKDADGESEVEWDDGGRGAKSAKEQTVALLPDIERVRMGRSRLAALCFYPGFEDMVSGCFVRVNITHVGESVTTYRLALIKGLQEGKPYRMDGPQGKQLMTDMYLLCAYGRAERPWPFTHCSDSPFTDAEFDHWKRTMENDNLRIPMKSSLEQKRQDYLALKDRRWTNLEIDDKIRRQNKLAHLLQKKDSIVTSQTNQSQGDKLAALNELNRRRNREEVRAAQIAEEKKLIAARHAAIKKLKEEEAKRKASAGAKDSLGVPKKDHDDLFSDLSDISRTGSPAPGAGKTKTVRETKNGIPTFTRPKMDDEIISALDMEIDLEV